MFQTPKGHRQLDICSTAEMSPVLTQSLGEGEGQDEDRDLIYSFVPLGFSFWLKKKVSNFKCCGKFGQ